MPETHVREQAIADVLLDSIVLTEMEKDVADEETIIDREEAAFKRLHPMLREKYLGQYVAIHQGKLLDHDPDQVALFLRTKEKYPEEFIWIAPVREEPEETYVLRSHRFDFLASEFWQISKITNQFWVVKF